MALQLDPTTGLYVDQATGHVYTDASGTQLSTDPGLTAQAQRSLQASNQLYARAAGFVQQAQQAQTGQTQLGEALDRTIQGAGPSVAATQLAQSQEQIQREQQSEAAGATGQDAALARYSAMQNTADAQAKTAQAGAELRAQEVAQAEQAKGNVLAQQGAEANQGFSTSVAGATGASGVAANTQGNQAQIDEQNHQANLQLAGNVLNAVGGVAGATLKGGTTTSDEREKTDVAAVKDADMEKLLKAIHGYSFDYKNVGTEGETPGRHVSPMAQDVQDGGPLGKAIVIDGKPLKLDNATAVGTALAAIAYLNRKLDTKKDR